MKNTIIIHFNETVISTKFSIVSMLRRIFISRIKSFARRKFISLIDIIFFYNYLIINSRIVFEFISFFLLLFYYLLFPRMKLLNMNEKYRFHWCFFSRLINHHRSRLSNDNNELIYMSVDRIIGMKLLFHFAIDFRNLPWKRPNFRKMVRW